MNLYGPLRHCRYFSIVAQVSFLLEAGKGLRLLLFSSLHVRNYLMFHLCLFDPNC